MHMNFHTLKRQWGAHTLAAVSPICSPPTNLTPPYEHAGTHTRIPKDECVCPFAGGAGENLALAIFIFIRAEGACVFVCIHTGCVPGLCACVFVFLCVRVYISSFTSAEEKRPLLLSCCIKKMENNNNNNKKKARQHRFRLIPQCNAHQNIAACTAGLK